MKSWDRFGSTRTRVKIYPSDAHIIDVSMTGSDCLLKKFIISYFLLFNNDGFDGKWYDQVYQGLLIDMTL